MESQGYQVVTEESYGNGDIILKAGHQGNWVYVIESGAVELSKMMGDKKIVLEILRQGDAFGGLDFITNTTRAATCRVLRQRYTGKKTRRSATGDRHGRIVCHE